MRKEEIPDHWRVCKLSLEDQLQCFELEQRRAFLVGETVCGNLRGRKYHMVVQGEKNPQVDVG